MPTGTRSSIRPNRMTNPTMATTLVSMSSLHRLDVLLAARHRFGLEDQPVSANGDQQHRRGVASPGDREEWPGGQSKLERLQIGVVIARDLVDQRVGLHRHD